MGGSCSRLKYMSSNSDQNGQTNSDNEPPPMPTKTRKSKIVPDVSMFTEIDEHVKKTPFYAKASVAKLVEYLIRPAKNDLDKVRAIYKYIQLNISYDIQSYRRGTTGPTDSKDVLQKGQSVCAGYSNLFEDMCKCAGIQVKCISGYAKGLSYNPEDGFSLNKNANHDWNVVYLYGEWRFVDSTWGAGHINSQMEFERRNTELYFLTDPKVLIQSHFPYVDKDVQRSQKWQLLKHPIDLETFNRRVKGSVIASELNIEFVSHKNVIVEIQGEDEIVLRIPNSNIILQAHLRDMNGTNVKNCLILKKKANTYKIRIRAPCVGKYKLEVYGTQNDNSVLDLYVTYIIHFKSTDEKIRPFPDNDKLMGPMATLSEFGISEKAGKKTSYVAKNGTCTIKIPVLKTVSVMVKLFYAEKQIMHIDSYVMITASVKYVIAKVNTPEVGFYKLTVYAKHLGSSGNSHEPVLSYLIENKIEQKSCPRFPKSFATSVTKHQVSLVEPCTHELQGNTIVTFKLVSPLLEFILAANQKFEKNSNDTFEFSLKMPYKGTTFPIYGSDTHTTSFDQLFEFKIV